MTKSGNPGEWERIILRNICERVDYGYTTSAKREPVGPKFLRITDIVPDLIDWSSVPYCELTEKDSEKYRLEEGDIVIARTGATTGYAKLIKHAPDSVFASYLVRLRINEEHDKRYVGLIIQSDEYKRFIKANLGGAAQPQANAQVLTSFPMPLPPLPIQRKIADMISAYDDLIENNTRRIKIPEEMARAIYREWFVHFRFPGHVSVRRITSPLGPIPEGWEVQLVKDVITRQAPGRVYREADVTSEGTVPVIDQSTAEILGFHDNDPDHSATPDNPIAIFGDHTCKMQLLVEPFSVGPNVVVFAAKIDRPIAYVFQVVRSLVQTQEYKRHWTSLNAKEVIVADRATAQRFAELIRPSLQQAEALRHANAILRRTRDLLLPKLISGEIECDGYRNASLERRLD